METILKCENLCKTFGKRNILKNVSLEIKEGDILGFLIAKGNLDAQEIGKIDVADHYALAAIPANKASDILEMIRREKIKNKRVKISVVQQ